MINLLGDIEEESQLWREEPFLSFATCTTNRTENMLKEYLDLNLAERSLYYC